MKIVEVEDYIEITLKCGAIYKADLEYKILFENTIWYKGHYGYLQINNNGIRRFHRTVIDCPKGLVVDHINRDVSDNRRINLRAVTHQQNNRNRAQITGKYKGVSWSKHAKKWRSTITVSGKLTHLGYFKEEKEAANAYNLYIINELDGDGYINDVLSNK